MSIRPSALHLVLLACATAALTACTMVDPVAELHNYTDECRVLQQCSEGFACVEGHCRPAAGAACVEGFDAEPCELTAGVCADAKRACVGGFNELSCGVASYGATYEALETSCHDGLDNDCDGLPEVRRAVPLLPGASPANLAVHAQLVHFGSGYLLASTGAPGVTVSYRVTDAQLRPRSNQGLPVASYVDRVQQLDAQGQPLKDERGNLLFDYSFLHGLQLLPYEGGAFVLWTVYDATEKRSYRGIARLEVESGSSSGATVSMTAREFPLPELDLFQPVRGAVAADRSSVLFTWVAQGALQGQSFDLNLAPRGAPVVLSAPLASDGYAPTLDPTSPQDVSPNGSSGFAVAWGSSPFTRDSRRVVRFRTVSGDLAQLGEVLGSDLQSGLSDLRLLAAPQAGDPPLAAWISAVSTPAASSVTAAATASGVVLARPFVPGEPPSPVVPVDGVTRLNIQRDGNDFVLVHSTGSNGELALRRFAADGSSQVRPLGVRGDAGSVSLLTDAVPDMWSVMLLQQGAPSLASACRI